MTDPAILDDAVGKPGLHDDVPGDRRDPVWREEARRRNDTGDLGPVCFLPEADPRHFPGWRLEEVRPSQHEDPEAVDGKEAGDAAEDAAAREVGSHEVARDVIVNQRVVNEPADDADHAGDLAEENHLHQRRPLVRQIPRHIAEVGDVEQQDEHQAGEPDFHPVVALSLVGQQPDGGDEKEVDDSAHGDVETHLLEAVAPLVDVEQLPERPEVGAEQPGRDAEDVEVAELGHRQRVPHRPETEFLARHLAVGLHLMNAEQIDKDRDQQAGRPTPKNELVPAHRHFQKLDHLVEPPDDQHPEQDVHRRGDPGPDRGRAPAHRRRDDLQLQRLKRPVEAAKKCRQKHEPHEDPDIRGQRVAKEHEGRSREPDQEEDFPPPPPRPDPVRLVGNIRPQRHEHEDQAGQRKRKRQRRRVVDQAVQNKEAHSAYRDEHVEEQPWNHGHEKP